MTIGAAFIIAFGCFLLACAICSLYDYLSDRHYDAETQEHLRHPEHPTPPHQLTRVEHEVGAGRGEGR